MPISDEIKQSLHIKINRFIDNAFDLFPDSVNEMLVFLSRSFHHIFDYDGRNTGKLESARHKKYLGAQKDLFSQINRECKKIYTEEIKGLASKDQVAWFDLIEMIICEKINQELNPEFFSASNIPLKRRINAKPESLVNPRLWLRSFPFAGDLKNPKFDAKFNESILFPLEIAIVLRRWDLATALLLASEQKNINITQPSRELIYRDDEFVTAYLTRCSDVEKLGLNNLVAMVERISTSVNHQEVNNIKLCINQLLSLAEKHKNIIDILAAPIYFPGILQLSYRGALLQEDQAYKYIVKHADLDTCGQVFKRDPATYDDNLNFKFDLLKFAIERREIFSQLINETNLTFDYSAADETELRLDLIKLMIEKDYELFKQHCSFTAECKLIHENNRNEFSNRALGFAIEYSNLDLAKKMLAIDSSPERINLHVDIALRAATDSLAQVERTDVPYIAILMLDQLPRNEYADATKQLLKNFLETMWQTEGIDPRDVYLDSASATLCILMKSLIQCDTESAEISAHNQYFFDQIKYMDQIMDLSKIDPNGKNILDHAIELKQTAMIQHLISIGASPNIACADYNDEVKKYYDFAVSLKNLRELQPSQMYTSSRDIIWQNAMDVKRAYLVNLSERLATLTRYATDENHLHFLMLVLAYCNHQNKHANALANRGQRVQYSSPEDLALRKKVYDGLFACKTSDEVSTGIRLFKTEENKFSFLSRAFPNIHAETESLITGRGSDEVNCTP